MILKILEFHARRYPLSEPTDAVKLLYQNAFGVGHMIASAASFRERLETEMRSVTRDPAVPLTEPIGNGLVRVMLNSPEIGRFTPEALTAACIKTAEGFAGDLERFGENLRELESAVRQGLFAFTPEHLAEYLEGYRAAGCPPVSHSGTYHRAYHPAYRVVKGSLLPQARDAD